MGRRKAETKGLFLHYVIVEAKSWLPDKEAKTIKYGPYPTLKEAQFKKLGVDEAPGESGYLYETTIETVPNPRLVS